MGSVNYFAVIASAILAMGIGFAWYGPLFGKEWQHLMGFTQAQIDEAQKRGIWPMALMAVGALLMAFVLASMIVFASTYMHLAGIAVGVTVAILTWIGFVVPLTLSSVLWDNKTWKLWGINAGYYLAVLALEGVIFGVWM